MSRRVFEIVGSGLVGISGSVIRELQAHDRRVRLLFQIHVCSNRRTAFACLWLARAAAIGSPFGLTVEEGLQILLGLIVKGFRVRP